MLGVDDAKIFHDEDPVMKRAGPGVVVIFSIPLPLARIAGRNKRTTSFLALENEKAGEVGSRSTPGKLSANGKPFGR
jgi:hypothetical protein